MLENLDVNMDNGNMDTMIWGEIFSAFATTEHLSSCSNTSYCCYYSNRKNYSSFTRRERERDGINYGVGCHTL